MPKQGNTQDSMNEVVINFECESGHWSVSEVGRQMAETPGHLGTWESNVGHMGAS